jgi:hypothetical protein
VSTQLIRERTRPVDTAEPRRRDTGQGASAVDAGTTSSSARHGRRRRGARPPRRARRQPPAGQLLADAAPSTPCSWPRSTARLEAALALDGGSRRRPVPPSALDLQLLAMRARQLGGDVPRRRGHRLGVLHPRTS